MSTKKLQSASSKSVAKIKSSDLVPYDLMDDLSESAPIGEWVDLPEGIPDSFRKSEFFSSEFPPSPKWENPGQMVYGIFCGKQEEIGPHHSTLYHFETPLKKGGSFRWGLWGTKAIDSVLDRMGLAEGEALLVCYSGNKAGKNGNMKDFRFLRSKGVTLETMRKSWD